MPIVRFNLKELPAGFSTHTAFYSIREVSGAITLMDMTCPHRGGPLTHGIHEGDSIICPWHGSRCNRHKMERRTKPAIRHGEQILFITEQPLETVFVSIQR